MKTYNIVGIAGSLRKDSYNRALLKTIVELAPEQLQINILNIGSVPLYNKEIEQAGTPKEVLELKETIQKADGLILVTPEYNHSVSGVLKNVIDWASRQETTNVFDQKIVAIAGATDGNFGTVHAQRDLRWMMSYLGAYAMPKPDIFVSRAQDKFINGELVDKEMEVKIKKFLDSFVTFLGRFV